MDFGHYTEFNKSSIVNHCKKHVRIHAYVNKSRQMDRTEVNDRAESLRIHQVDMPLLSTS